jgi:hypothetical protein
LPQTHHPQPQPVIFMGAGASRCCGIPISSELDRKIFAIPVLKSQTGILKRRFEQSSVPFNTETLLAYLEASANKESQWKEFGAVLLTFVREDRDIDKNSVPMHDILSRHVKRTIRKECYVRSKQTLKKFPLVILRDRYSSFFRGLTKNKQFELTPALPHHKPVYPKVEIFTTNYDDAIETFFEMEGVETTDGYADSGLNADDGQVIVRFDENEFRNPRAVKIYRLYGSIRYARKGSFVTKVDPYLWSLPETTGSYGDLLVYPGSTKIIWNEPQLQLFYRLQQRLLTASYCIVIGYSFRDRAVAEIFHDALRLNTALTIFLIGYGASKIVRDVFGGNPSVRAIEKPFEKLVPQSDLR